MLPRSRRKPQRTSRSPELQPELQIELTYRQAQKTIDSLRTQWVTSPRERSQLEPMLRGLGRMQSKLDRRVIHIAVLGLVGRGKSSLLNALLGESVFVTGPLHGVTQRLETAHWILPETEGETDVATPLTVELWDTPGLDEVQGDDRERLAQRVAQRADLILFVISGDLTQIEWDALHRLRRSGKPLLLVLNKVDQYPECDREAIYAKIQNDRLQDWISPTEIVMTAAAPVKRIAQRQANGQVVVTPGLALPQVEDLKARILEILQREGLALLTLNSLLYAQVSQNRMVECKLKLRETAVDQIIWQGAVTKATTIALNPIAIVDVMAGAVIDVSLILSLARLYGLPLNRWGAWRLLRSIGLSMAAVSASELFSSLGLGSMKTLLGASLTATGGATLAPYISIAVTQGAVAGVSSYAVGQVAKRCLIEGCHHGEASVHKTVERVLANLDEGSILARLRSELQLEIQQFARKSLR